MYNLDFISRVSAIRLIVDISSLFVYPLKYWVWLQARYGTSLFLESLHRAEALGVKCS